MPIGFDDDTTPVSLRRDAEKPEATRPAFLCRFLAVKGLREYRAALKEAMNRSEGAPPKTMDELQAAQDAQNAELNAILLRSIAGFENLPVPFNGADSLDAVLTLNEKWELVHAIPTSLILTEGDKKKLRSPSSSTGASSVPPATEANVETAPAK